MDLLLDTQHTFSEAQEALWADAKIDGRAVFSVREAYRLHRSRLIEVQDDVERLRWVVKGCKSLGPKRAVAKLDDGDQASNRGPCPLRIFDGIMDDIFGRVAEHLGQNYGDVIKFIQSWPVYSEGAMSMASLRKAKAEMLKGKVGNPTADDEDKIRVFIRKRPLLPFEEQVNEWDVVSVPEERTLTVHEGRVAQSGRRLVMHLAHYTADAVVSTDILPLFRREVDLFRPDQEQEERGQKKENQNDEAAKSKYLTVLMYGQTGTGKTYTMRELVDEFFVRTQAAASDKVDNAEEDFCFELQCFEVLHKSSTVYDLLDERKQVKLLEDSRRQVHSKSRKVRVAGSDAAGALAVMQAGMALRMSEATERNAQSSRSHAFFIISKVKGAAGDGPARDGDVLERLRLVDLAGSERNFETQGMSSAQHRQSAEINSSLMVLKSCLRTIAQRSRDGKAAPEGGLLADKENAASAGFGSVPESAKLRMKKVPFRESRLTHLLQDCFDAHNDGRKPSAPGLFSTSAANRIVDSAAEDAAEAAETEAVLRSKLVIVATVSPCARDAIHTRNTLNHVCDLGADPEYAIKNCILDLPLYLFDPTKKGKALAEWTEEEVSAWLGNVAHGRFARLVLPEGKKDGKGLLSLTPDNLAHMFETETMRNARRSEEGASWNLMGPDSVGKLGRLFYRAVQRAKQDSEAKGSFVQAAA